MAKETPSQIATATTTVTAIVARSPMMPRAIRDLSQVTELMPHASVRITAAVT